MEARDRAGAGLPARRRQREALGLRARHHVADAVSGRSRREQRLPVRAAVCPAYGPPDVVRIEEQQPPAVEAGQVRVRVSAAAVNFPDVLLIADQYQISVPVPFVPGSEFAGVIVETGSGTSGFAVGDRVTGTGMCGAFAEEVAVAAAGLGPIPDGIDDRTAAAFGVAYRTAYHTLRSVA